MQFAILISVLVAVLLSAFLLLTHVHSFFRIKSQEVVVAFDQANRQLFESLEQNKITKDTIVSIVDVKTSKQFANYHGVWQKRYTEVDVHNQKAVRIAYTGAERSENTPNLYIEDRNSPIVVVGATRLEGKSYIPKQGIKAGNISGKYYQGNALYYGRVLESKTSLPEMNPEWIRYLENIIQGDLLNQGEVIVLEKELKNTFYNPLQVIYDRGSIFLDDEKITGNIVIQSGTKIIVGSGAKLTDVVLIAPEIIIKTGVIGSFQSIATKNIKIERKCYLSYPSSAILIDKKIIKEGQQNNQFLYAKPDFVIDKGAVIEGVIVYLNKNKSTNNRIKTHVEIASNATVIGEVYCQGNVDFQGTVLGSLYAQQCIARQSGSVYLNHIYNGKILLNPVLDYAGLPFVNSKYNIAKWLY
ncbi:hypothetical protein [Aquimarina aquimarini]|uniref:hypothetical protein n=1 Tax=Aquimarina aquimarini TaxID=1191734 RepID=UPI00131F2D4B|nr:hypothetical protein [Aquimarina aquimarini]